MTAPTSKTALEASAVQIRDEMLRRNNTATRVGTHLLNVVDAMPQIIDVSTYGVATSNTGAVNDVGIALAIAAAVAGGGELYWPAGTYPSAASISSLHSVRHRGPGAIQRGSDVFYIQAKYGQTNRFYVSASGSSGNDGLSSSQPTTLAQAAANLRNYGPVLDGTWKIIGAAGTYSTNSVTFDTASRDWIVVQGPSVGGHPNIPTMILDGTGAGSNHHGFVIGIGGSPPGIAIWFQDIKCQNYNAGAQNSCGWSQGYGARCIYVNCHAYNCDFAGILADQGDICLVSGGIINACRDGVVLNSTKGTIGYGGSALGNSTQITSCTEFGVFWSRGAQGHCDYVLFDQNARALRIESAARVHVLGTDFRRSTTAAISTNTDGSYYDDASTVNAYNDGTGNANAKRYEHFAYTGNQQNWNDASISEMCIYAENPGSTLTSATKAQIGADLVLPNPTTADAGKLRRGYFIDKKTIVRFVIWGDTPSAASSIGVDFNDGTTTTTMGYSAFVGTPAAAGFKYELRVAPTSATGQRGYAELYGSTASPRIESGATTANMTLPQTVRIMGQSATGTLTVRRIEVWAAG